MNSKKNQKETSKGEQFTNKIPTSIFFEEPSEANEFIAEKQYMHGYEMDELVSNLSYPQMLYLMMAGDLPDNKQTDVLHLLLKWFITPGIRHPATRAAMNAGIGRTHVTHILPISLSVLSADYLGSKEVGKAMQWLTQCDKDDIPGIINFYLKNINDPKPNPIPGFGTIYGSIDTYTLKLIPKIKALKYELPTFSFVSSLLNEIQNQGHNISWLPTGIVASLFLDIGLNHRNGTVLFQILQSPGLAAHGVEKANKPLTDMPFISENNYDIKKN